MIYIPLSINVRDREERNTYAREFETVFQRADWRVTLQTADTLALDVYAGIVFMYEKNAPPDPHQFDVLKNAFDAVSLKYTIADNTYAYGCSPPCLYIGEK